MSGMKRAIGFRAIRESRGMACAVLAVRAGITRAHVYALESGVNRPLLAVARRVAVALGASVDRVFPQPRGER